MKGGSDSGLFTLFQTIHNSWSWAFFTESLLMLPIAILCFFLPFTWRPERAPIEVEEEEDTVTVAADGDGEDSQLDPRIEERIAMALLQDRDEQVQAAAKHMTVKEEFLAIIKRPIYLLNVAGYAANTGMMIGVSTFGSGMLMEFGYVVYPENGGTCN